MTSIRVRSLLTSACVAALTVAVGCSHRGAVRPQEQPGRAAAPAAATAPVFGAPTAHSSESSIETRRQVTIAKRTKIPTLETSRVQGDINRMEVEHFEAIGIPTEVSKHIIEFRDDHGPFRSVDQLKQVPGMDQALFDRTRDKLTVAPQQLPG